MDDAQGTVELSIVVPMFNEEAVVDIFFERLEPIIGQLTSAYEIICVNDGSRDGTVSKVLAHRERDPRIKLIDLSRNFGKEQALTAGLMHTVGQAVIPIDADLQDPPEVILQFWEKWKEGFEVVCGVRSSRESDAFLKRFSSETFYSLYNKISDEHIVPDAGDFRLMDRKVVDALARLPERNRFMKGLFAWVGYKQACVTFERQPREAGTTKWNYWRLWNFALDGITSFSSLPLKVWSYLGLVISLFAFIYAGFLIVRTIVMGVDVPGYASIMVVVLFLGGIQLLTLGVIGEYVARIYQETKERPLYIVHSLYGISSADERKPF